MPTFDQHPFHLSEKIPFPPELAKDPLVVKAFTAFYDDIINRAQDKATMIGIEMSTEEGVRFDLTREEIEMFQMGASLAITTMAETLDRHCLLHPERWVIFVRGLLQ